MNTQEQCAFMHFIRLTSREANQYGGRHGQITIGGEPSRYAFAQRLFKRQDIILPDEGYISYESGVLRYTPQAD